MAVNTAAIQQQALRRGVETEDELRRRLAVEAQRQQRIEDILPTPMGEAELAAQQSSDQAEALRMGQERYRKTGPRGRGLIGAGLAWGADKLFGDKKRDEYTEQAMTGLTKAREVARLKGKRLNLDKARGVVSGQEYETSERVADQGYGTTERKEKEITAREVARLDRTQDLVDTKDERRYQERKAETLQRQGHNAAYVNQRLTDSAEMMTTSRKSAHRSYKDRVSLNNFLKASKDGREGGAEPIISGIQNFLVSFGFPADGLTDVATMQQGVAGIKANYMQELGARGLTDKDMDILSQALPQIATSQEAREAVVRILQKQNTQSIFNYLDMVEQEQEQYPELKVPRTTWYKDAVNSTQYGAYKELRRRRSAWQ